ncbi:MAG: hypothetical protein ABJB66_01560 [Gemmatimonadaceae bacterium]
MQPNRFAMLVALIFTGAALLPQSARAQKTSEPKAPATAVGKWAVQFERTVMTHTDTTSEHGRARLVLVQQGDSVLGTWQRLEEDGSTVVHPLDATGVLRRDSLRIELTTIVDPDATFSNIAHDISVFLKEKIHGIVPTTTVLELVVRGDSLVGTVRAVSRDGVAMSPAGAVTATRLKQ